MSSSLSRTVDLQSRKWEASPHYINRDMGNTMRWVLYVKPDQWIPKEINIKNASVGYTGEKVKSSESVYPIVSDLRVYNYSPLGRRKNTAANMALNDIEKLPDNWNGNNAAKFSKLLITKCRGIVDQLVVEPFVCPTACGSIQMEYEKKNGDYLEFEVYEDRIEVFMETLDDGEREFMLREESSINKVKQLVGEFYA